MESKLQELTNKIYQEGVVKAETEAKNILDKANDDAKKIVDNAKKEAESIISNAKNDAEQLKNKTVSELKLSGNQAVTLLKQNIIDLLSASALSKEIKESAKNADFIKELIKEIVLKWSPDSRNADLSVILPEKMKSELESYFMTKAKDILNKGVELKFDSRMSNGFKIGPKDNSFVLSFSDKDFEQFFQSFLKVKTKEILFPKG